MDNGGLALEIADIEADGDTFNPCDVAILGGDPFL